MRSATPTATGPCPRIAAAASVSLTHGGFYAHFKSKNELVAAAISAMFDEHYRGFRSYVESPKRLRCSSIA